MKYIRSAIFSLILMVTLGTLLTATTVIPMSVEELTSAAPYIVRGHVLESWSAWDASYKLIYTYTRFQTEESLKGTVGSVVVVKQLGGTVGEMTLRCAGVHPWSNGESAVLFLRPSQDQDGTFAVVGLMQGDFRVRRSASGEMIADNGLQAATTMYMSPLEDVHAYSPATKQLSTYSGSQLKLGDLETRIRTAVAGGKNLQ
jgi:hypothetical protein